MCEYKKVFFCEECPHYCDDCGGDSDNMEMTLDEIAEIQRRVADNGIVSISQDGVHLTGEKFFEKFGEFQVKKGRAMVWVSQVYDGVKFYALANEDEVNRELGF